MKQNVVCIIQARMGSSRLPGKVLKEINNKPMLQYTLESLKKCKLIDKIILATSTSRKDDPLENFAKNNGSDIYRGSEENVLSRYYHAAKENEADVIVRITGDCPLIDSEITDAVVKLYLDNKKVDFAANNIKRTFPRGVDTSVFSFAALQEAYDNAKLKAEKEHVVPYIKNSHKQDFKLINYEAKGKFKRPDIRITVDEKDDFKLVKKIIQNVNDLNLNNIIDFLNEKPELLKINSHIEQKKVDLFK